MAKILGPNDGDLCKHGVEHISGERSDTDLCCGLATEWYYYADPENGREEAIFLNGKFRNTTAVARQVQMCYDDD